MSLPSSVGTVRIGGTIIHPDTGAPIRTGRVEITYPYPVYATTDRLTVVPGKVTAKITDGVFLTGPLLDPHDPDITPQGYAYTGRVFSDEWTPDARLLAIPPGSAGLTLDWTALGDTTTAPAITTYALVSQLAAYITKATLTAKGALAVATAAGIVAQLAAGGNGLVLTTDSSTPTGLKWAVAGSGGGGILTVNGQSGPDVELAAADVGAAAVGHDHVTGDVLGLAAYVDGRAATLLAALVDAAPSTLDTLNELAAALGDDPNFAATITTLLGGKQPLDADLTTIGGLTPSNNDLLQRIAGAWAARTPTQVRASLSLDQVDNTSDANKPVSTATTTALAAKQAKITEHRRYNIDASPDPWYPITDTGGTWTVFAAPGELTLPAAVGDRLRAHWSLLARSTTDWFMDLAVVTGAGTIKRYLSSGTATGTSVGNPTNYPTGTEFQGIVGHGGFTVTTDDLDTGTVRLAVVVKATAGGGRFYAATSFPFGWSLDNIGPA